ncbi:MAG: transaldolase family protein [Candidatus Nealsonbacteria bacterium]
MKIFIDSAKISEIEDAYSSGILDGVTTNPSLIKKAVQDLKKKGEQVDMEDYIKKILKTAKGTSVSLEVTEFTYGKMVQQGKALFEKFNPISKNVYIKIPINTSFEGEKSRDFDGLRAIKTLTSQGIPVNCTLIFTPEQALLAAKAGAKIVSPFAGRIDDYLRDSGNITYSKPDYFSQEGRGNLNDNGIVSGIDLIRKIVEIFKNYQIKTEVLAASIRNTRQVREAALAGADIATLPIEIIKELLSHYKTREGMKTFTEDAILEYVTLTN